MSALKNSGYGDGGRAEPVMSDDFMGPERNGRSSSGIVVDGVAYQLAGQPPLAQSHGWGDLGWALRARRAGVTQVSIF